MNTDGRGRPTTARASRSAARVPASGSPIGMSIATTSTCPSSRAARRAARRSPWHAQSWHRSSGRCPSCRHRPRGLVRRSSGHQHRRPLPRGCGAKTAACGPTLSSCGWRWKAPVGSWAMSFLSDLEREWVTIEVPGTPAPSSPYATYVRYRSEELPTPPADVAELRWLQRAARHPDDYMGSAFDRAVRDLSSPAAADLLDGLPLPGDFSRFLDG